MGLVYVSCRMHESGKKKDIPEHALDPEDYRRWFRGLFLSLLLSNHSYK